MNDIVLQVNNLEVQFQPDGRLIKAVDGISFEVKRGQTLGHCGRIGFREIGDIAGGDGVSAVSWQSNEGRDFVLGC
jgi:ABC-type antimicrobial peptide transport system ATPase subunit